MGRICIRIYSTVSAIRGEIELKRKVMSCRQKSLWGSNGRGIVSDNIWRRVRMFIPVFADDYVQTSEQGFRILNCQESERSYSKHQRTLERRT